MPVIRLLSLIVLGTALAACGYKGPLYLPGADAPLAERRIPAAPPAMTPDSTPQGRPVPSEAAPVPQ